MERVPLYRSGGRPDVAKARKMKALTERISKRLLAVSSFVLLLALILTFTPLAHLSQYLRYIWYSLFVGWAFIHGFHTGIDYVIGEKGGGG